MSGRQQKEREEKEAELENENENEKRRETAFMEFRDLIGKRVELYFNRAAPHVSGTLVHVDTRFGRLVIRCDDSSHALVTISSVICLRWRDD
jgi:hypothetical protein